MRIRASKIRFQGTRDEQQDTVNVLELPPTGGAPARLIAVLADGIGGLPRGAETSAVINGAVSSAVVAELNDGPTGSEAIFAAMDTALGEANEAVAAYQRKHAIPQAGSTLICCVFEENLVHHLSVGDSFLFGISKSRGMVPLNDRHTHQEYGRSYLASAVLGGEIAAVDHQTTNVADAKFEGILLSSDGISTLPTEDVAAVLQGSSESKLREIVALASVRNGAPQDNLSMILVEYD